MYGVKTPQAAPARATGLFGSADTKARPVQDVERGHGCMKCGACCARTRSTQYTLGNTCPSMQACAKREPAHSGNQGAGGLWQGGRTGAPVVQSSVLHTSAFERPGP